MNFDRLRFVSERAMLGEGSEVFLLQLFPNDQVHLKTYFRYQPACSD